MPKQRRNRGPRHGHRARGIDYAERKSRDTRQQFELPESTGSGYDQRGPSSHAVVLWDTTNKDPSTAQVIDSSVSARIPYVNSTGEEIPPGKFRYACLRYPRFVDTATAQNIAEAFKTAQSVSSLACLC